MSEFGMAFGPKFGPDRAENVRNCNHLAESCPMLVPQSSKDRPRSTERLGGANGDRVAATRSAKARRRLRSGVLGIMSPARGIGGAVRANEARPASLTSPPTSHR